MATETQEVNAIFAEADFVKFKVNGFTKEHVYNAVLPEANNKLNGIREALDKLMLRWFTFKATFTFSASISKLETEVKSVVSAVDENEKEVREKVAQLISSNPKATDGVEGSLGESKYIQ